MEYLLHILILIGIYTILSVSLNLLVGYTGILSIAHAAFYGVGAYVAALMALKLQTPFLLNLFLAVIASGLFGAVVGIPSLRLRDDYFVIATFAFQIITFSILNNLVDFTGGPLGLPGISQPNIFGFEITTHVEFLVLVIILAGVTFWISNKIVKSPFGRLLKAIREDEIFVKAAGRNVSDAKVKVFVISASLASIAGVVYATYITYIDPTSFTIMESIFIISIVIIGGSANLKGSIVGSIVLVALPELLRFIGLPNSIAANIRQILYGALLVIFMLWRPQGFLGEYKFGKESAARSKK
ncbi:MAG: branched-chain amino acid ABC transporter permease [Ignavibacteria bacterium]|nr:branched-chain amino acid ABC transporter permease [Ignavibacteria bacterium]PIX94928.1 MAG: branched-chain amino acid ABC transporter permease [Ignavibacteria bacterium CG_4_10_14_3_um_filter_37_18]PJC59524.1 MAG: branched-chain amino acid ABC transporter permease [Ignavibacteria bacterium CG_4_9_14_0_2_um_filter_37_13]